MSEGLQQVALFCDAVRATSSEVIDFRDWFLPAF